MDANFINAFRDKLDWFSDNYNFDSSTIFSIRKLLYIKRGSFISKTTS